jgi:plastocyanin
MASLAITVIGIRGKNKLVLSDGGITTVNPGDTVTWVVNSKSGVAAIIAINDDSKIDLFKPNPVPLSSASWQGKIKTAKVTKEKKETYTIKYLKIGDSKIYRYDPEIEVKPKPKP